MTRLIPVGRVFFAIGLGAFGIMQFIFGDFIPGRAPSWPAVLPGGVAWAYLTGAVFVAVAAAIIAGKKARWAALVAATLIFVWAVLRHIPVVTLAPVLGGEWTSAGKALVLLAGVLAAGATFPPVKERSVLSPLLNQRDRYFRLGAVVLGLFMILCGIQHFVHEHFVATLVPTWIPGPYFWTYFAGVALIAGGLGLLIPATARLAAALSGLMIFLWVIMLHIPRALSPAFDGRNEWTSVFEALALSGLAFMLSQVLPARRQSAAVPKSAYAETS